MIDMIFTAGSLVFIAGLLPAALNSKTQVPLKTSLPTALVLAVYAVTFVFMGLMFSAASSTVTSSLWAFIAIHRRA